MHVSRSEHAVCLQSLKGHTKPITCLQFDNKESSLMAGSSDGSVKVFSLASMQEGRHLRGSSGSIRCTAWHPLNAALLGTAGAGHAVKMWDLRTKNNFMTYTEHAGGVDVLTFSPDGRWLFVGDASGTVTWWDLTAGKQLAVWTCFESSCTSIAFHPTDFFVVASSALGQCAVCSLDTKTPIAVGTLQAEPSTPGSQAAFLHSGTHVLLTGGTEAVLYDFAPKAKESDCVLTLAAHLDTGTWHGAADMWCGRRRPSGSANSDASKRHAAVVAGVQGSNVIVSYLDVHTLGGFQEPPSSAAAAGAIASGGSRAPPSEGKESSPPTGGIAMQGARGGGTTAAAGGTAHAAAARSVTGVSSATPTSAAAIDGEGKEGGEGGVVPDSKAAASAGDTRAQAQAQADADDSSGASLSSEVGAENSGSDEEGGEEGSDLDDEAGDGSGEEAEEESGGADPPLLQYRGPALPNHPALAAAIAATMALPPAERSRPRVLLGDAVLGLKSHQFMPQTAAPAANLGATAVVASLGSRVGPSAVGKLKGRERAREALRSGHGRPPSAAPSTPPHRRIPRASSAAGDSKHGEESDSEGGSEHGTPLSSAIPLGHSEHSALAQSLRQRLDRICDLRDMWRRGEMDAFVAQLVALQDHAVACDVLGEARLGGAGLALHHVTQLGPLLGAMLQRTYSGYINTALSCLTAFVRSFAPVVAGAVGSAPGGSIGVNVAAEARAARCVAAWDALHAVYDAVAGHLQASDSSIARSAAEAHALMGRQLFTPALLQARAKLP